MTTDPTNKIRDIESKIRTMESRFRRDFKRDQTQKRAHDSMSARPSVMNTKHLEEKTFTIFDDKKGEDGSVGIVIKINNKVYKLTGLEKVED